MSVTEVPEIYLSRETLLLVCVTARKAMIDEMKSLHSTYISLIKRICLIIILVSIYKSTLCNNPHD
jgi:hypothetical protein